MNYRHIYHAGNFADIFKHFIVYLSLQRLTQKDTPFMALDAFAGLGRYPLRSTEAQKTLEYRDGVELFLNTKFTHASLSRFQEFLQKDWAVDHYPGSPLLMRRLMRPKDRLIANELHPEDGATLKQNLESYDHTFVTYLDAYTAIKAHIPPPEKRGFILIDPPFERRDEFDVLIKNMKLWQSKFTQGHYAIWYPIKAGDMSLDLIDAARALGIHRSYVCEFLRAPRNRESGLNGCGMLLLNAPYTVIETLTDIKSEYELAQNGSMHIELLTTA